MHREKGKIEKGKIEKGKMKRNVWTRRSMLRQKLKKVKKGKLLNLSNFVLIVTAHGVSLIGPIFKIFFKPVKIGVRSS